MLEATLALEANKISICKQNNHLNCLSYTSIKIIFRDLNTIIYSNTFHNFPIHKNMTEWVINPTINAYCHYNYLPRTKALVINLLRIWTTNCDLFYDKARKIKIYILNDLLDCFMGSISSFVSYHAFYILCFQNQRDFNQMRCYQSCYSFAIYWTQVLAFIFDKRYKCTCESQSKF